MRSTRPFANLALAILATIGTTTASLSLTGCSQRNGDIDRVVEPYWAKDYFDPANVWYYRATVVDTAPGNAWSSMMANGHWGSVERLKWEVTERHLVGYRDYAAAPGTEEDQWEGADDVYDGQPVAIFPITGHFDVQRSYDSITGEESNQIVENVERPWFDRAYFRVDWARNLASVYNFPIRLMQVSPASYTVQPNDVGDPKRWRFDDDYFETVTRGTFEPDLYSYYGFYGPGYAFDTSASVLDLRHSFWREDATEEGGFQPTPNPPSVVLENEDGSEVRGDDGMAVRVPVGDRFGFFSSMGRNTWNPERGFTYSSKDWNATLFNIWENSKDAAGNVIPVEDRTPKPIVYYTNVGHPKELLKASIERVGGEWNKAFKEVVYYAQPGKYDSMDDVPEMFIAHENDCNVSNVESHLEGLSETIRDQVVAAAKDENAAEGRGFDGTIESVRSRYDLANSKSNTAPFTERAANEQQALADLERICSALEWYTDPKIARDESVERFTYQREGDLRYSLMNLIYQETNAGWLGFGPMYSDPLSGRTLSASANIALNYLDTAVERYNQYIDTLNGMVEVGDLLYGFDIQEYMSRKLAESQQLTTTAPSAEMMRNFRSRLSDLGPANEALRDMSAAAQRPFDRVVGTPLENKLVGPQDAALFGAVSPAAMGGSDVDFTESMMESVSPARGRYEMNSVQREKQIELLGQLAMDVPEFLDNFAFGLAMRLRDVEDREERRRILREEAYVSVQQHEVGHNVGLMHNFEASSDALNYGREFWRLQELPADMEDALGAVSDPEEVTLLETCIAQQAELAQQWNANVTYTTQDCLGQTEHMHSSVMDYHGAWNGRYGGIGPYDVAAVKFGYGHLVETFPEENLNFEGGHDALRKWTFLSDWRDIPEDVVEGFDAINEREHVSMEWTTSSTRMPLPDNAVPYRFCYGGMRGTTPWCRTGDTGPDTQTNASLMQSKYWQYYFFSHFNRDRLWDWGGSDMVGVWRTDEAVMWDYTLKMQWYVYQSLTDPDFAGSYAEQDFMATTYQGMNFLSQVISHPRRGYFINVPRYDVGGMTDDLPDADRLAPSDIMMPWNYLFQCEALSFAEVSNGGDPVAGRDGFRLANLPLGDGRPFFMGLTEDYEEYYVRYIGTYWAKQDALYWLGYNFAYFPGYDADVDPRAFNLSWYRLFPREVERILYYLTIGDYHELGPVVDEDGQYYMRDAIDPATGEAPDYEGHFKIFPSISFNHQYFGLLVSHALMSSPSDNERDFSKSFKVAVEGAEDDFGSFDLVAQEALDNSEDPADYVAEFVHPTTGERIRALKSGEYPVAYKLVQRLNVLRARYDVLNSCVNDEEARANEPYCACVQSVEVRPDGRYCADPFLEAPGTGECTLYSLERRRDSSLERMEDMVDYIKDVRWYNKLFSEWGRTQ